MTNMEKILYNLALINLLEFSKKVGIDCSGTHLIKTPRKYLYTLVKSKTGQRLVAVRFSSHSIPTHIIYEGGNVCLK